MNKIIMEIMMVLILTNVILRKYPKLLGKLLGFLMMIGMDITVSMTGKIINTICNWSQSNKGIPLPEKGCLKILLENDKVISNAIVALMKSSTLLHMDTINKITITLVITLITIKKSKNYHVHRNS